MKKYRVTLAADEREQLRGLLARGKAAVRQLKHAQILLKADEAEGGPGWGDDERIAEALEVGTATVERVRRRFAPSYPARAPLSGVDCNVRLSRTAAEGRAWRPAATRSRTRRSPISAANTPAAAQRAPCC